MAVLADTAGPRAAASAAAAPAPGGRQPSGGTRTRTQLSDMKIAYATPSTAKVDARPLGVRPNQLSSALSTGEAISAPPPKPMIAIPVAMPGRSMNHLISVETGEM